MNENAFQAKLIKDLKDRFPGCIIEKTDSTRHQGMPDLIILYKNHWAALEVKKSKDARHRPNQDYRVQRMNEMSFASFIYPENKEEVINDLARAFEA